MTNRYITGFGDPASTSPAAGQYQGANATATKLWFPLVKNQHNNKSTTIIVQNAGTANATASATFYFPNWTYTYTTPTLKPGQMAAIEPIDAHSGQTHPPTNDPINSLGSLTVTSSQPLAGIALEHNTMEDHATVLQATRGFISSDANTILYAPINKHNWYGRFTGLMVQNLSSGYIDITVTYTANDCNAGTIQKRITHIAQNHSAYFDALNDLPDNCFAPAKIEATGNIVAVVNEAYTGDYLNTHPGRYQEATAYNAISNGVVTRELSVPLFKEDSYSKATGLSVQNISDYSTAHVIATFRNSSKAFMTVAMDIPKNQAIVLQDMRLMDSNPTPPSWWHGWVSSPGYTAMNPTTLGCDANGCGANGVLSVILLADHEIVAVANESTYPIETPRINQDKSNYEAFNLPVQ